MQSKRLTLWILFALVAGVVSGYVIHHSASGWAHAFAGYISLLTDIFLRRHRSYVLRNQLQELSSTAPSTMEPLRRF